MERKEELERAILTLEWSSSSSPASSHILVDLGAARYVEAFEEDRSHSMIEAVAAWQRAAETDPGRSETYFNLALGYQALGLTEAADRAWKRSIELAPDSPWTDEARVRRVSLLKSARPPVTADGPRTAVADLVDRAASLVASAPEPMFEFFVEQVLPELGQAMIDGGQAEREGAERTARAFAEAIAEKLGDVTGLETLARLEASETETGESLARGLVTYGDGCEHFRNRDAQLAEAAFRDAARWLSPGPLSDWAALWLARLQIAANRYEEGRGTLARIESTLDRDRHRVLAARVRWFYALSQSRRGLDTEALADLRRGLELFESLGFEPSQASMHNMIADELGRLGRTQEEWRHRLAALRILARYPDDRAAHNTFLTAAEAAAGTGSPSVALAFLDRALGLAERRSDGLDIAETLFLRGRTRNALNAPALAGQDFEAAARQIRSLPDSPLKERALADVRVEQARLAARSAPRRALQTLGSLLEYYQRQELQWKVLELLLERSRLRRSLGAPEGARNDLEEAIGLLLEQNRGLGELTDRYDHAQLVETIFDEVIRLQMGAGVDPSAPLAYAEASRLLPLGADTWRSLALPDDPADYGDLGGRLRRLAAQLPERTLIVEYVVLEDRLAVWTMDRRRGVAWHEVPVDRQTLAELGEGFGRALRKRDRRPERWGSELYRRLVAPVREARPGFDHWVIVPDRFLHALPFAALRDPETGDYLVQSVEIGLSPSLLLYMSETGEADRQRSPSARRGLFIADPALDLKEAGREVDASMRYYGADSVKLQGAAASRHEILELLPEVEVLHFAGHAVVRRDKPFASFLLTAATGGPAGITVSDLFRVEMPRLELAILSGCETADAAPVRAGGLASFATPFLLNGAQAVVGSLWRIGDRNAADFMTRLHAELTTGAEPRQALRRTQLAFLKSNDPARQPPAEWASYVVLERRHSAAP